MRESWERAEPVIEVSAATLRDWVRRAFPEQEVVSVKLVSGGLSNTNYQVTLTRSASPVRLRVYNRGAHAARLELAVTRLVPPSVASPRHLYCEFQNEPPFAFLEWRQGDRLEAVFPELLPRERQDLGDDIGWQLAQVHGKRFERTGFFNLDGAVAEPFAATGRGLLQYAQHCFAQSRAGERVSAPFRHEFLAWLPVAATILDEADAQPCLTHGDFGASNIIVARNDGRYEVTGIIDWEYACSGIALFDLGNLLRPPFDADEPFVASVAAGYTRGGGALGRHWKIASKVADLFASLEMLSRDNVPRAVVQSVEENVTRTMHGVR